MQIRLTLNGKDAVDGKSNLGYQAPSLFLEYLNPTATSEAFTTNVFSKMDDRGAY